MSRVVRVVVPDQVKGMRLHNDIIQIKDVVFHQEGMPAIVVALRALWKCGVCSRLSWEAIWSLALRIAHTVSMLLLTALLARFLGARGYGIYAYAYTVATLLAMPFQSGLPNLVLRETSQYLAQNRFDRVRGVWEWSARIGTIGSLLIMLVGGPLLIYWQGGLSSESGRTMAWALLLVPSMALCSLCGAALRGLQRVIIGQLSELALQPGLFLLLTIGVVCARRELSTPLVMALHTSASLLTFAIGAWLLWWHVPETLRRAKATMDTLKWTLGGVTFTLIAGFAMLNNQASTVILGLFDTPGNVGRFRIAVQMAGLASLGLQSINMIVAPRFADLWARNDKEHLQRLVTRSAQIVLVFNLLATIIFALAGRLFLRLFFGPDFDGSYIPLLVLLVGQMVNSAAGSVGFLLNMTGYERDTMAGMGIAVGLNLILNLALVPLWGMIGASIASAASMVLWNALLWWRVRQRLGINSLAFNL